MTLSDGIRTDKDKQAQKLWGIMDAMLRHYDDDKESHDHSSHDGEAAGASDTAIDLQQTPLATELHIVIENPQVILKDRLYLEGHVLLDLGLIQITNEVKQVKGRFKKSPKALVWVNKMEIGAK